MQTRAGKLSAAAGDMCSCDPWCYTVAWAPGKGMWAAQKSWACFLEARTDQRSHRSRGSNQQLAFGPGGPLVHRACPSRRRRSNQPF